MKRDSLLTYLLLLLLLCGSCKQPPEYTREWKKKAAHYEEMADGFKEPPLWYAPHAHWFWDSPLDRSQLREMARQMNRQRLNTGYVHATHWSHLGSSSSLPEEAWLSEPWFDAFRATLEEAESERMYQGYCDEYVQPSGQAAGRVLENYPSLKKRSLKWQKQVFTGPRQVQLPASKFTVAGRILDREVLQTTSMQVIGEGPAFRWEVPSGNWMVYSYAEYDPTSRGAVNYLNPDLINLFIPIAHYPYMEHFPDRMGNAVPGVYVDHEGDFGYKLAWSEYLPIRFREMKEKELLPLLPLLTEKDNEGLYAKLRYDWFDVVSDIYGEHFVGRLSQWLEEQNMYYVSNFREESLLHSASHTGDLMFCQRQVSVPGTGTSGSESREVQLYKETQSVCEFENKPFMSEILEAGGWGVTPLDKKRTVDALISWGVNHFVIHGIHTDRDLWDIPNPPDWYTENPSWKYLNLWSDYTRRASYISRQGNLVADILLYCPLESIWALADGYYYQDSGSEQWSGEALHINTVYSDAMRVLTAANQDYLIADKHYLAMAEQAEWYYNPNKTALEILGYQFPVLVLPPMFMISRDNARKILDFARSGGYVIALGTLPEASVEVGFGDPVLARYMAQLQESPGFIDLSGDRNWRDALPRVIHRLFKPQVRFTGLKHDIRVNHRKLNSTHFYWIASNEAEAFTMELQLRDGVGCAEIWNCENGSKKSIAYKRTGKDIQLRLDMEPYQGFWLVFNPGRNPVVQEPIAFYRPVEVMWDSLWSLVIPGNEPVRLSRVRTLRSGRNIDSLVFEAKDTVLPWTYNNLLESIQINEKLPGSNIISQQEFSDTAVFGADKYWIKLHLPPGATAIEMPGIPDSIPVWVDGDPLIMEDQAFKVPENSTIVLIRFDPKWLPQKLDESIRIYCDGVSHAPIQPWLDWDLHQYSGYVDYTRVFEMDSLPDQLLLDLGEVLYTAQVWINGKEVGSRMWPPYHFEVRDYLHAGENNLKIRVGNLVQNELTLYQDQGLMKFWGSTGEPVLTDLNAGLLGPIRFLQWLQNE